MRLTGCLGSNANNRAPEVFIFFRLPYSGREGQTMSKANILVIDDSMPLRRMLVKIITGMGYTAWEAADGNDALKVLGEHDRDFFSLIFCDLIMPKMNGAAFVKIATKDYPTSLLPIVICSSRSDPETIKEAVKMGVQGYLLKPFKTQSIRDKIMELIPQRLAREGNEPLDSA